MNKKVIIFDLDGTLLNTLEDLTDSTNYALSQCGYDVRTLDEVKNFVGNGVGKLIERALGHGYTDAEFEKCLDLFKTYYSQNKYNKTKVYSGILEMLEVLKSSGYRVAVVSNKFDKAVKELCEKYFPDLIDLACGENEASGVKKKPAPDTVLFVMKKLGAEKSDCIYVGDSEVDIMTANNCEIPCISVSWGFKSNKFLYDNGAEIIADTPDEVLRIIKSLS